MAEKRFLLPDLGEGLTEGEIIQWVVEVGDQVEVDQVVVEIETAKAVVEVPSPFAGTVLTLHAAAGELVQVGEPLLSVDVDGAVGRRGLGQCSRRLRDIGWRGPAAQGTQRIAEA
jgi:2-oxoisovalerate dehydrogenase E2 component (dihydrolipoyl transacylase)